MFFGFMREVVILFSLGTVGGVSNFGGTDFLHCEFCLIIGTSYSSLVTEVCRIVSNA